MRNGEGLELNWLAYQYRDYDGYGRYSIRIMKALENAKVKVSPSISEIVNAPAWIHDRAGLDWRRLTISCLPAYYNYRAPGRHWLISMTEGSKLPEGWAAMMRQAGIERVIVPCEHNRIAFGEGMAEEGLDIPINVINGGTCPAEFQYFNRRPRLEDKRRPYTFVTMADRGSRKGWVEAYTAFFKAFGTPENTPDVRLIIKARPKSNHMLTYIASAAGLDKRIEVILEDYEDIGDVWRMADCVVMPSRSEGFGMPHREAAMTGAPVITQKYAGLDDGFTERWSIPVVEGRLEPIPTAFESIDGYWRRADVDELADKMKSAYLNRISWHTAAIGARQWLAGNQTWQDTADELIDLISTEG